MGYTLKIKLSQAHNGRLEKVFKHAYKLKREVVQWFNRQEYRRQQSPEYHELAVRHRCFIKEQQVIKELSKDQQKEYEQEERRIMLAWAKLNAHYGLANNKYIDYKAYGQASNMYEQYNKKGIVNWSTFERIIQETKDGYLKRRSQSRSINRLRVPKESNFKTIWFRKMNQNVTYTGLYEGRKKDKIFIPFDFKGNDEKRLSYALTTQRLAMHGITRELDKYNRWQYYALLVFDGEPYRYDQIDGRTGLVKIHVSLDKIELEKEGRDNLVYELKDYQRYADKITTLDLKMSSILKSNNPDNYNEDGSMIEEKKTWHYSNRYKKLLAQKRYIIHKLQEHQKNWFNRIASLVLGLGDEFLILTKDFEALRYTSYQEPGARVLLNSPMEFVERLEVKLKYNKTNKIKKVIKKLETQALK